MAIATSEELNLPILQELRQKDMTTSELEEALAKSFQLTDDERVQKAGASGQTTFLNNILWSVGASMGDAELVTKLTKISGRQVYGITNFGRSVLDNPPPVINHRWLYEHSPNYAAKYGPRGRSASRESTMVPTAEQQSSRASPAPDTTFYDVDCIVKDGCFLPRSAIEDALKLFDDRQNLVLQGPPGTGKTWLARRLGYALLGEKNSKRLHAIQFHPTLSYEDFVRGLRFSKEANGLDLVDGLFLELSEEARLDPGHKHVLVIEEINRGNPAQIFGELLTLIEPDKRGESLRLAYPKPDERFHVPANLYIIGTMNLADRSLALVDFALRRRFAFIELEPTLGHAWREWCQAAGMPLNLINLIAERLRALNKKISDDRSLGPQFCIGHSFVTPVRNGVNTDWHAWFGRVIKTEIGPLLREYWYDNASRATDQIEMLLDGIPR
jgi:hypothetical protein